MLQQAIDFKEESDALFNLLKDQEGKIFQKKTQFKGWTINNVLHHLHVWNIAADMSLNIQTPDQPPTRPLVVVVVV